MPNVKNQYNNQRIYFFAFDISSTNIVAPSTIKNIIKVVKEISEYVIPLRIES